MATTYSDSIAKFGRHVFGEAATYPIRRIELSDLGEALRLGWEDFKAMPSHAVVVCVIYPVLGIALFRMVLGYSVLPLLFPLAAGFALLGPFAAIGLYELFVDPQLPTLPWLAIKDIDDLKARVLGVVIVVLGVLFLGQVISWDGERDLLGFGVAVALVIAALTYFLAAKSDGGKGKSD